MQNKNESQQITKVIGFVKEQGIWYADLPEYLEKGLGEKSNLMMVDGADTFLDILSGNGIRADVLISTKEFGGYDAILIKDNIGLNKILLNEAGHAPVDYGAYYTIDSLKGLAFSHRLWLCPVTEYVCGGYYPEKIYIKTINNKTMKRRKTIYHLIVDKSGSMSDCIDNTISGMNEQIINIKNLQEKFPEEDITIGISTFNHEVIYDYFLANPSVIKPFTEKTYQPAGNTALLDAIGITVQKIENVMQEVSLDIPTTTVVIIITDGHENASRLYDLSTIRNTIARLEQSEKWTFSFLGATIDAVEVARDLSINSQNSFSFAKGDMKTEVWDLLNSSMDNYIEKKQKGFSLKNLFGE